VDALILKQTSPEDAFNHLDDISNEYIEDLRKITKCVQEARAEHNEVLLRTSIKEYDATIEAYIPILMAQATIYWDKQNYDVVEKIFRRSIEFCNDQDAWKLNVAHTLFMQEDKYKEAITFYEPFIEKNYDNVYLLKNFLYGTDFRCDRYCIGQYLCFIYHDVTKRASRRPHETC
jgi:tetratricopeptide repeat protein 30